MKETWVPMVEIMGRLETRPKNRSTFGKFQGVKLVNQGGRQEGMSLPAIWPSIWRPLGCPGTEVSISMVRINGVNFTYL